MSVGIDERYRQVFEAHRHASDYRLKLLVGWGALHAAFAAAFVWAQTAAKSLSWMVTLLWAVSTAMAGIADVRVRPVIKQSKKVGKAIEADKTFGILVEQRFFWGLEKGVSHSRAIDVSAAVMLLLLGLGTVYLIYTGGQLPT